MKTKAKRPRKMTEYAEACEALGFLLMALDSMKCEGMPAKYSISVRACMTKARRVLDEVKRAGLVSGEATE